MFSSPTLFSVIHSDHNGPSPTRPNFPDPPQPVFHAMEKCFAIFPHNGKNVSTLWKTLQNLIFSSIFRRATACSPRQIAPSPSVSNFQPHSQINLSINLKTRWPSSCKHHHLPPAQILNYGTDPGISHMGQALGRANPPGEPW